MRSQGLDRVRRSVPHRADNVKLTFAPVVLMRRCQSRPLSCHIYLLQEVVSAWSPWVSPFATAAGARLRPCRPIIAANSAQRLNPEQCKQWAERGVWSVHHVLTIGLRPRAIRLPREAAPFKRKAPRGESHRVCEALPKDTRRSKLLLAHTNRRSRRLRYNSSSFADQFHVSTGIRSATRVAVSSPL